MARTKLWPQMVPFLSITSRICQRILQQNSELLSVQILCTLRLYSPMTYQRYDTYNCTIPLAYGPRTSVIAFCDLFHVPRNSMMCLKLHTKKRFRMSNSTGTRRTITLGEYVESMGNSVLCGCVWRIFNTFCHMHVSGICCIWFS